MDASAGVVEGWVAVEVSVKSETPARCAISCSPKAQCIASAARQGIPISCAMISNIWRLNLCLVSSYASPQSS